MRKKADEFERALHGFARGEPVRAGQPALIDTARRLKSLAEAPPPPHGLVPGRQRFLSEAARLRQGRTARRQRPLLALRLAAALAVLLLVFGAVLGAGRASADSLPGDPLYGVKRAAETVRLAFTSGPQNRAALIEAMAEERMSEILAMLEQGRAIGDTESSRASQQLREALAAAAWLEDTAAPLALQRLAKAIREREQAIRAAAGESPAAPVQALLREMERVREEAHLGQGDPDGLRRRLRHGEAPEPSERPGATPTPRPSHTATPPNPSPGATRDPSATQRRTGMPAASPEPSGTPHPTPAMTTTPQQTGRPHETQTPQPSVPPGATAGPHGTPTLQPSVTPQHTGEPRATQMPGATVTPQASRGTPTPGQGGTASPTTQPGGTPAQTPGGGGGNKP